MSTLALDATWEPSAAELILLAAEPPATSCQAFCDALQGLLDVLRHVMDGKPVPESLILQAARAAGEAFPLDSVESWALFRLLSHADRVSSGRAS